MTGLLQDLRYAVRALSNAPGFTAIAALTLALGIGANTAMFAVVNAVLLKPLPFANADRLMLVHLTRSESDALNMGGHRHIEWSYPKYRTFLDMQHTYDNTALFADREFSLSSDQNAEHVRGEVITDRYPAILGATPLLGRPFTAAEAHRPGEAPVAIISYRLWVRRYAGDHGVVGRTIHINATPYTVVAVMPQTFRGLSGNAELWVPLATFEPGFLSQRGNHSYYLVARRRADVSERAAIPAVERYGREIDSAFAGRRNGPEDAWGATAVSLDTSRTDTDVRQVSLVLLCAVGLVLLIACVNLTNLFAIKAIARRREVAIRIAIGATRLRVARQFFTESLVLAGGGGALGILLAMGLLNGAAALLPDSDIFFNSPIAPGVPRMVGAAGLTRIGVSAIEFDAGTLIFASVIATLAAALIALAPAMQASALHPIVAMKNGLHKGTERGFNILRTPAALVTAQIALALVLLAGAGLMVKSAARLYETHIGVDSTRVLTMSVTLPPAKYKRENGLIFYSQLVDRVRALPGVTAVGLGSCAPVSGGCNATSISFPRDGAMTGTDPDRVVGILWATPGYFSALRIPLVQGRAFADADRTGLPKVALVNETAARTFWPNESPIGQTVAVGQGGFQDGAQVVGVVADVRYGTIETNAGPGVYVPLAQSYFRRMRIFVRSSLDEAALVSAIRREARALDPDLPLSEIKTMEERVDDAMWRTRVGAWLFSAFAGLALVLTAVGIFGAMAQTVSQRTPEIGVRMALGAQRRDVIELVLGRATIITGVGIALGLALAAALTRAMTGLLYQVEPNDASNLLIASGVLMAVAVMACYLPARRAARVDPLVALRYE